MKIAVISDPHLVKKGGVWDQKAGVWANWSEAERQLAEVISRCNDAKVELVIIAGDMFDNGHPEAEGVARVLDAFKKANFKVIVVNGNHDQSGVVAQHRTPIDAFIADQPWCLHASSVPEIVEYNGLHVALMPWLKVAGTSQQELSNRTLADEIDKLAQQVAGKVSIFSGHMVVDEAAFDSGRRGSELEMTNSILEASVPAAVLDAGPWVTARLGHIHKRQDITPKVSYEGSLYKVSFGEHRDAKGFSIIDIEEDGTLTAKFERLDVREYVKVDVSDHKEYRDLLARDGDIVRFILEAEGEPSDFDSRKKELEAKGVIVQTRRKPKEREVRLSRVKNVGVDIDPRTAIEMFMSKQGLDDNRQKRILAEYADLMESGSHG